MKRHHFTSTAAALGTFLALVGLFWAGCGKDGGSITNPGPKPSNSVSEQSAASSTDAGRITPGVLHVEPGVNEPSVVEGGGLGQDRGYTTYFCPWADSWYGYNGSGSASMSRTTGVGSAYARCWPGHVTTAWCGVKNSAGIGYRWLGPNRTANVILKSPTRFSGDMVNWDGARASIFIDIKEYLPNGRYNCTYEGEAYWITTCGSFSQNLDGWGVSFPAKFFYLYSVQVYGYSYAHAQGQGAYCNIGSAELKKFAVGY